MKGIRRPSPRPHKWAPDVVRASRWLWPELRAVWRLVHEYDTRAGCWASAMRLAGLLGMSETTFENAVRELVRFGLLIRVQGPRDILFATLPTGMPTTPKLEYGDKLRCAERLDRHIESLLGAQTIPDNDLPPTESLTALVPEVVLEVVPEVKQSLKIGSKRSKEIVSLTSFANTVSESQDNTKVKGGIPMGDAPPSDTGFVGPFDGEILPEKPARQPETLEQRRDRLRDMARLELAREQREAALKAGGA